MIKATIGGLPDLKRALLEIPEKLRKRALRNALAAGARVIRNDARRLAPVISATDSAVRRGVRAPGTLRNAISVRTSKIARRKGDVGVFVNVRPAPKAARGARSSRDPFYWRFVEFGTRTAAPRPFLQPAAQRLAQALEIFKAKIGPAIAKLNRPRAPAPDITP